MGNGPVVRWAISRVMLAGTEVNKAVQEFAFFRKQGGKLMSAGGGC